MRHRWTKMGVWLLLLFSLACSVSDLGPRLGGREAIEIPGDNGSGGDQYRVSVVNESPYDICYVYVSESRDDFWGENILPKEMVIEPGVSQPFLFPQGRYDVLMLDCDKVPMHTAWDLTLNTTLLVGGRRTVPIRIVNESTQPICYVYVAPSDRITMAEDRLGDREVIEPNGHQRLFFVSPGRYDLRVDGCADEVLVEEYAVEIVDEVIWTIKGNR